MLACDWGPSMFKKDVGGRETPLNNLTWAELRKSTRHSRHLSGQSRQTVMADVRYMPRKRGRFVCLHDKSRNRLLRASM